MSIQPFHIDELEFADCYRIYLHWRTHQAKPIPALAELESPVLEEIGSRYDIQVLQSTSTDTDVLLLASLRPAESVAACTSKLKGQVTKWLREKLGLSAPASLFSSGYLASTTGKSTTEAVDHYLCRQSEQQEESERPCPPVYVRAYDLSADDKERLKANHAVTDLQHHVVLATQRRRGVFGDDAGQAVATCWHKLISDKRAVLLKVSFLPDHAHLALRVHPAISPAGLIVELMNSAQELMWSDFSHTVAQADIDRLWQPSAYLASYGKLESSKISSYVKRWKK